MRGHLARNRAQHAKKNELKPWQKQQWCIPEVSAEFVACMEDVLELYEEPYDPQRPVVCFDETNKQLIEETRVPLSPQPAEKGHAGQVARKAMPDKWLATITSTSATAPAICLCIVNPKPEGVMWR